MDVLEVGARHPAAGDAALVGDHDHPHTGVCQQREALQRSGSSSKSSHDVT
ncbi:MAG: hypothetical protein ACXVRP_05050 [Solirubrobacteraceae bacterium]